MNREVAVIEDLVADVPDMSVVMGGIGRQEEGVGEQIAGDEEQAKDSEEREDVNGPRGHITGTVTPGQDAPWSQKIRA